MDELEHVKTFAEHIQKAIRESRKRGFKENTIIIDKDLAYTNGFFTVDGMHNYIEQVQPSIFGLKIVYDENLAKDFGYNFIVTNAQEKHKEKALSDYTDSELLQELLRRRELDD